MLNHIESYKIIAKGIQTEIQEKKSRFIISIEPVDTEQEAIDFIEASKKKYWNASHNCTAFVIGSKAELVRCNDDGEPSGTAGHPMLEVLIGSGIRNVVAVVTRYFGGTLLGTGGLVRAYSAAVKAGLALCTIENMIYGIQYKVTVDYTGIGKIQYLLAQRKILIINSIYEIDVTLEIMVPFGETDKLKADIIEAINGKAQIEELDQFFFQRDGTTF